MSYYLTQTCESLMRAVVRSGCIRDTDHQHDADVLLATRVMREELRRFISAGHDLDMAQAAGSPVGKYVDERALALTGQSGIAMASLVAECIRRILAERQP